MKWYRAIERGYDNVKVREPGEKFQFGGKKAPWMEEIEPEAEQSEKSAPEHDKERKSTKKAAAHAKAESESSEQEK